MLVCTRTQEKGAVIPQDTDLDLPRSVQESSVEVWVGGGLLQSWRQGSFEGGRHYLHYLHHSLERSESEVAQLCQLFATPWSVAHQAPLSMGFSRQEYWSGLPFPSLGDLPDLGIEPRSPSLQADTLASELPGKTPTIVWPQINSRKVTQLHPSTGNWIKDLLGMALPIRTRPNFSISQSLPSGSFSKPLILLHQRADRMQTTITEN